jgi:hypothetical protein
MEATVWIRRPCGGLSLDDLARMVITLIIARIETAAS